MIRKYKNPIVVRMDDICPTMDFKKFETFSKIFDDMGITPLLGLVPENTDPKLDVMESYDGYWEMIRSKVSQGWDVSMHGVHHTSIGMRRSILSNHPRKTEFSGEPLDKQLEKLSYGKSILKSHGIDVDTFMPPYHSYDTNTLKALHELQFKYISDGRSRKPYSFEGIMHIPANDSWKLQLSGVLTICIHSNEESEKEINDIEHFLDENISHVISFKEACEIKPIPYSIAIKQQKAALFCTKVIVPGLVDVVRKIKRVKPE